MGRVSLVSFIQQFHLGRASRPAFLLNGVERSVRRYTKISRGMFGLYIYIHYVYHQLIQVFSRAPYY